MNLRKLIELAAEAYEPSIDIHGKPQRRLVDLLDYVDADGHPLPNPPEGDTLALFVVRELKETFEASVTDDEQLRNAASVMELSCEQLEGVVDAFKLLLSQRETDRICKEMQKDAEKKQTR